MGKDFLVFLFTYPSWVYVEGMVFLGEFVTGPNVNRYEGTGKTPSSLLEQVKGKDADAWERLVHLFTPLVYRWCRNADLQEADAADVGQEVFKAVLRGVDNFNHGQSGATMRGWLRAITANKIRDFWRREGQQAKGMGGTGSQRKLQAVSDDVLLHDDEASQREDKLLVYRRAVDMILASFDQQAQRVFVDLVVGEQPAAQVAREAGLSVNAVYLIKSRILRRIREEYAGLVEVG